MKKVLIVAYNFPPIASSGSLRPLRFCRYLDRYGWLPRVLTTDPLSVYPLLPLDDELCRRFPAALQVDRVPHANPLQTLIYIRNQLRGMLPLPYSNEGALPGLKSISETQDCSTLQGRVSAFKDLILDRLFSFPDNKCFWLRPAVRRVSKLPRRDRPDVVFATGKPWTSLLVGKSIAQRFGVPFVADFRDPLTGNPTDLVRSISAEESKKKLEQLVCMSADRIISTTPELSDRFIAHYPTLKNKFLTITNGYDNKSSDPGLEASHWVKRADFSSGQQQALELCHFGTIYGSRSPIALFQAIQELLQEKKIKRGQLRMRFVGDWLLSSGLCESLARDLEREGLVSREPSIPHELCLRQMATADVLLILQPGFPLQIPAKIYEYIAATRPLLVIGGEGATASLVERHRLGRCCPNQVSDIKKLVSTLINRQAWIEPPLPADTQRFDYQILTGELARVLDSVCAAAKVNA